MKKAVIGYCGHTMNVARGRMYAGAPVCRAIKMVFAALLCCAAVFAQSADVKPQIAVYVTGGAKDNEKKALNTEMLYALVKSGRYIAVERSGEFLGAVAAEHKKQRSGAVDEAQIRALGKQFGVTFVCIADITEVLNTFQVSARVVNVETAAVDAIGKAYSALKTAEDYADVSAKVVESMFGGRQETKASAPATELTSAEAFNSRGIERHQNGDYSGAIADFTRAVVMDPAVAAYHYNRGMAYAANKDLDSAIAGYTAALRIDRNHYNACVSRADAYAAKSEYRKADDDYTAALLIKSDDARLFTARGNVLRLLKDYDSAIRDFESALRIDPNSAKAAEYLELAKQEKPAAAPRRERPDGLYYMVGQQAIPYVKYSESAEDLNAPYVNRETPTAGSARGGGGGDDGDSDSKTQFGIRAGFSIQNIQYFEMTGNVGENDLGVGIPASLVLSIPCTQRLSIVIEGQYRYKYLENERYGWNETSIDVPIFLRYSLASPPGIGFYCEAGGQLDIPLSSKMTSVAGEKLSKPLDLGGGGVGYSTIVAGGGVTFYLGGRTCFAGYRGAIKPFSHENGASGIRYQHDAGISMML